MVDNVPRADLTQSEVQTMPDADAETLADIEAKRAKLEAMSDRDLAVMALRQALIDPLAHGLPMRDAASVARLLLEMTGAVGKHAAKPDDDDTPLHELSPAQLAKLATKNMPTTSKGKRPKRDP
jgi:hypothetical protein